MTSIAAETESISLPKIPVAAGNSKGLRVYSKIVAWAVFFLIFMGALVTSHDAGLAVPDWPTSFGENMFLFPPSQWRGIIFYEHVHRLIASGVGLLTVVLGVWTWFSEQRRWVRLLTAAAVGAVVLQGLLGGLTVLYLLPAPISSLHAVLGQTFFVMTIIIAYSHSKEFDTMSGRMDLRPAPKLFRLAAVALLAVYVQLILGAFMRHTESGLAIPDFPAMGGELVPRFDAAMLSTVNSLRAAQGMSAVDMGQVAIHFAHRAGGIAVVVMLGIALIGIGVRKDVTASVRGMLKPLTWTVLAQFALGAVTVLSRRSPWIASAHVALGAGLLAATVLLAARIKWGVLANSEKDR